MFCDGTFNVAPFHAPQLLIILGEINGKPRPIIYTVMTNRLRSTYAELFEFLRDAVFFDKNDENLTPRTFMSDFERAARTAAEDTWPGIDLVGCNFHFCQALQRKASTLKELSTTNGVHRTAIIMFMRLSLLPADRVNEGLAVLGKWLKEKGAASAFINFQVYFNRVWMKHYPPSSWCVSSRPRRTNCNIEGYNNFVKQRMRRNPTPWTFLEALHDLAHDASSKFVNDRNSGKKQIDRSCLTEPLQTNLAKLKCGEINVLQFLLNMAAIH